MSILMNDATSVSVSILTRTNELFGITQKRVASGKSIFTAADDTTRYRVSETLLGRSGQLSDINNNISVGLATLETTDKTLTSMISLVESAIDLTNRALNEGAAGQRAATTTANLSSTSVVSGVSIGSRLSITSDGGKNFTYTFNSLSVTWGEIANAINAANIGVLAKFVPSATPGDTNLRFYSVNDEDFSFDGTTDQNVMDDLVGLTTPTGQVFNPNNLFANGIALPAAGETGFTIAHGGQLTGNVGGGVTLATAVAAGSTFTFEDGNGGYRSLSYPLATTLGQVINDITAMGAGIKAELVNQTGGAGGPMQFRLRNMNGGNMKIISASGDFAGGGSLGLGGVTTGFAAPLSADNTLRLAYGQQYDAIIQNLDQTVINNPVPKGRNLLRGENISVMLDEYAGTPLKFAGVAITAAGTLTMAQAGATWINDQNILTSATQAKRALDILRDIQAQFATFNNYIRSRFDLNRAYQSEIKTQGDELVAADVTEESAKLTTLRTRQDFAVQAIAISNQNAQSMLRLLGQ